MANRSLRATGRLPGVSYVEALDREGRVVADLGGAASLSTDIKIDASAPTILLARPFGGTGLGLATGRRLVAAMGGELTVTSEPGRGSLFSFALPASAATSARVAARAPVGARKAVVCLPGAASASLYLRQIGFVVVVAIARADLRGAASAAHALKLMSLNIGAQALAQSAASIERDARENAALADESRFEALALLAEQTYSALRETAAA